jgi:orotate phosphoribosyltransferase
VIIDKFQEKYIKALLKSEAVQIAQGKNQLFTLRNGTSSWIYIDHAVLLCDPVSRAIVVDTLSRELAKSAPHDQIVIANVDSKSSPHLAGAISIRGSYRSILVNPASTTLAERGNYTRLRVPTDMKSGDTIALVDDVMTYGDMTLINIASLLRANGITQRITAFVALSRGPTHLIQRQLETHNITIRACVEMNTLIEYMLPTVTPQQAVGLHEELRG